MRVYLVRHGEAKPEDIDPDRHLTERGADEVRRIATGAVTELGVLPVRVFHSGKARARQPAASWGGVVGVGATRPGIGRRGGGAFPGSFNPLTLGHLAVAEAGSSEPGGQTRWASM